MKGLVAFSAALMACFLAWGGLIALAFHSAVVEVLCIEVAGVAMAVLAAGLWVSDMRETTDG